MGEVRREVLSYIHGATACARETEMALEKGKGWGIMLIFQLTGFDITVVLISTDISIRDTAKPIAICEYDQSAVISITLENNL
jgi:hypothetical protein